MNFYDSLQSVWKTLGIKGQVKNFSSKVLWVLETDSGRPIARKLYPGFKSPPNIDIDAFKQADGLAIEGHKYWWKFYDFSTAEIFDRGKVIKVSVISKTAVAEKHFDSPTYIDGSWGVPVRVVMDVRRDNKGRPKEFLITGMGWIGFEEALRMTCHHEIDNARPVFPQVGRPFIRTRRDQHLFNNLSKKGLT